MSNLISENWQFATMWIRSACGTGTGFLVGRTGIEETVGAGVRVRSPRWGPPASPIYLVTARHVLGEDIRNTRVCELGFSTKSGTTFAGKIIEFPIEHAPQNWHAHPDKNIDVAALDVTELVQQFDEIHCRVCPLTELANPINMLREHVDIADEAYVLGYPTGLMQMPSALPLARRAILATSPRQAFVSKPRCDVPARDMRGFYIDAAIVPGSSGSPLVSASTRSAPGDLAQTPSRPLALGVVTDAYIDQARERDWPTNLGFVHNAATIMEVLLRFGAIDLKDFLQFDHDMWWSSHLGIPEWALEFDTSALDLGRAFRIMLRLHRDRMRADGLNIEQQDYSDAVEIMGSVKP